MVPTYTIRVYGDPVLKQRAAEVTNIDGTLAKLAGDMIETMRAAPGVGLAAPQVGVQKRLFVYELDDGTGPHTIVNPVITESSGEWTYEEGCLSVPGLYFPITRPKDVHVTGFDLDGRELAIEGTELLGRLLQHEMDHLNGTLLLSHLDPDQRKEALKVLRTRALNGAVADRSPGRAPAGDDRGTDAGPHRL
jgi:peptide deformylase